MLLWPPFTSYAIFIFHILPILCLQLYSKQYGLDKHLLSYRWSASSSSFATPFAAYLVIFYLSYYYLGVSTLPATPSPCQTYLLGYACTGTTRPAPRALIRHCSVPDGPVPPDLFFSGCSGRLL